MTTQSVPSSPATPAKWFLPMLSAIVAITPVAIDTYLPAMKLIAADLNTDMNLMQLSVSLFLAGYALGMLLFGALADIFGRKPVALFGLAGYGICALGLSFSDSIYSFLTLRFLQAFIGAAATVPMVGYVKDIYGKNMAKGMSYVSMILLIAPMIAPSIGVLILEFGSWETIFLFMAIYAIVMFAVAGSKLPDVERKPMQDTLFNILFRSYGIVLREKAVRRNILIVGLATLPFFGYLTAVSFIYLEYYGVSERTFGILFAINVLGFLIGSFANTRLVPKLGSERLVKIALAFVVVFGSALFLVNFFQLHLYWTVALLTGLLTFMIMFSSNNDALIILHFTEQTGTATGVIGVLRFGSGALAGPLLALLYDGTSMAFCYLVVLSLAGICLCMLMPGKDK